MLTKGDLKAIEGLLDSKLESKLEEKLESKLDNKLKPIYERLDSIETKVDKIDKKLDRTIDAFDHMHLDVVKNVRVIQKNLNLPIMDLA